MSGVIRPPPRGAAARGAHAQQMKLVLLGDQGVGKSSLALRFVRGNFREDQEATIGAAFLTQTVNVEGRNIKFDIWDTAGQERYHSLAPMYYRGAQAAIVVYDVTSGQTFERAMAWVRELLQQTDGAIVIALAGNKVDMAGSHREVQMDEAAVYAEDNNLLFYETSAKNNTGVLEVFMSVAKRLANLVGSSDGTPNRRESIRLGESNQQQRKCCGK